MTAIEASSNKLTRGEFSVFCNRFSVQGQPLRKFRPTSYILSMLLAATASGVLLVSEPACAEPSAQPSAYDFDIPAQSLADSLRAVASKAGVNVAFDPAVVGDKRAPAIRGSLSVQEALKRLLADSGLSVHTTPGGSYLISAKLLEPSGATDQDNTARTSEVYQLEEVVVTAQKRGNERLQDVPVPVSVINTESLTQNGQVMIRDYYSSVPGLDFEPGVEGFQYLSIRGLTTGSFTLPTVGVVIDDVPFGGSGALSGNQIPDFDPGDLARIEVLRGPQGTLYGANSMGGLLKFVTIEPSTEAFSGRVETGTSSVHNGAEPGFNIRGSANIPLGDELAIRVSGYRRQDPGYIDNTAYNINGVNEAQVDGGRVAALWKPSSDISLTLSALYQHYVSHGSNDVVPVSGDLKQNALYVPGYGGTDRTVQAYSAVLKTALLGINLTSVTGYNIDDLSDSWQSTAFYGADALKFFGVSGAPLAEQNRATNFTQEIRAQKSFGQSIDWQLGGFFSHQRSIRPQNIIAVDPGTGSVAGELLFNENPAPYEEYAAFTSMTYHLSDQFDVQLGGRETHVSTDIGQAVWSGPLVPDFFKGASSPHLIPATSTSNNTFTYLATPQFKVSSDLMVYARLASGFRPGLGANNAQAIQEGAPRSSNPDETYNYEIGAKGDFLQHKLSVDASLYYIDWKDIQLTRVLGSGTGYSGNGAGAKSDGVEISVEARPLRGLSLSAWLDYDDAVLTQNIPLGSTYGVAGDRLPFSSRFSGNISANEEFLLPHDVTGFIGGTVAFIGDRKADFTDTAARQDLPAYTKTDLRAGIRCATWVANIYVNNVADTRGLLNGGLNYFPSSAFLYIQPRTVGLNISKTFSP